jgi:hypothetical protein
LAGNSADSICVPVYGFVTGLGGLDVTPEMVLAAVEYASTAPAVSGPLYLTEEGIEH